MLAGPSLQTFPQADAILDLITDSSVELDHLSIRGADLKVKLRTTQEAESRFDLLHHGAAEPLPTMFWSNRKMVDPSAKAVEASQNRGNHTVTEFTHKKQISLQTHLPSDHEHRRIPRRLVRKNTQP